MIAHYAWADGLAVIVEAADHPVASVYEPDGWRHGDPKLLLPDGPPAGAERVAMTLPVWLDNSLGSLEVSMAGLHTDFVRIDRLVGRLQSQGAHGLVLVLGPSSAAAVLNGGQLVLVDPEVPEGTSPVAALAAASGWILILAGRVDMPQPPAQVPADDAPRVEAPVAETRAVTAPVTDAPAVQTVGPAERMDSAGERFVAVPGLADALPGDVAGAIRAVTGEAGLAVVGLLDGTMTVADIAGRVGLRPDQVTAVVKLLSLRRLAFRYVTRVRSTSMRRAPP